MRFATVFAIISQYAVALPLIAGAIKFKYLTKNFRLFYYFLLFSVAFEILISTLSDKGIRNDWVIHFFTPIEFYFTSMVLSTMNLNAKVQSLIRVTVSALLALWFAFVIYIICNSVYNGSFELFKSTLGKYEPISFAVEALTLTIFSILLLLNLFSQKIIIPVMESKIFWFSLAVLIYFIGNIVLYPALNIVIVNVTNEAAQNLYTIHSVFNFTGYLLFAFAFLCGR